MFKKKIFFSLSWFIQFNVLSCFYNYTYTNYEGLACNSRVIKVVPDISMILVQHLDRQTKTLLTQNLNNSFYPPPGIFNMRDSINLILQTIQF